MKLQHKAKKQANIAKVYLDSESSSVYGLMVTGMEVTDTRDQSEPILVNGWDFVASMTPWTTFCLTGVQSTHTSLRTLRLPTEIS